MANFSLENRNLFVKLHEKVDIFRKFAWKNQILCEIAWKNRHFSEICLEKSTFFYPDPQPQISNQIDAADESSRNLCLNAGNS